MIGHNSIGVWIMPSGFEQYVEHFNAADAAWRKFQVAINDLANRVAAARESPGILANPGVGAWPTQGELHKLYVDATQLSSPLIAEFSQLPQDVRAYAPNPGTVGRDPNGGGGTRQRRVIR
jgi:hypothetical protein